MTYIRTLLCTWTWSKRLEEGGETLWASYSCARSQSVQFSTIGSTPCFQELCTSCVWFSRELPSFLRLYSHGPERPIPHCPWSACSSSSHSLPLPPQIGGTQWQTFLGRAADYSCLPVLQTHTGSGLEWAPSQKSSVSLETSLDFLMWHFLLPGLNFSLHVVSGDSLLSRVTDGS